MKRILALVLSLVMCLSLAACGEKNDDTSTAAPASDGTEPVAAESTWPQGNINMYVNQSAGGGTDMVARLAATAMGEATGKNFVVINDTSGGTTTACEIVRTADPKAEDVLVCNTGTLTRMISGQYAQTLDDFSVLGTITTPSTEGYGLFVKADSPFEDMADLVAYCQENPEDLITSGQVGGFVMFMEAALEQQMDYRATFVEGGSDADRILTILGDSIDYALLATASASQYVENGDLRCLAMIGPDRSELIPDVPTLDEQGYKSLEMANILILLGPAGMSEADIERVGEVLKEASADPTLLEGYAKMNMVWDYMTPAESKAYLGTVMDELSTAYPVVQELGLVA